MALLSFVLAVIYIYCCMLCSQTYRKRHGRSFVACASVISHDEEINVYAIKHGKKKRYFFRVSVKLVRVGDSRCLPVAWPIKHIFRIRTRRVRETETDRRGHPARLVSEIAVVDDGKRTTPTSTSARSFVRRSDVMCAAMRCVFVTCTQNQHGNDYISYK